MKKLLSILFIMAAMTLFAYDMHCAVEAIGVEHHWFAALNLAIAIVWLKMALESLGELVPPIGAWISARALIVGNWLCAFRLCREFAYLCAYLWTLVLVPCIWISTILAAIVMGIPQAFKFVRKNWRGIRAGSKAIEASIKAERLAAAPVPPVADRCGMTTHA
jgi:hypothetical protein